MQIAFILTAKTVVSILIIKRDLAISKYSYRLYIISTCQGPVFQNGAQVAFSLLALQLQLP